MDDNVQYIVLVLETRTCISVNTWLDVWGTQIIIELQFEY